MTEETGQETLAPKLHGTFTLSRLAGAGVALTDKSTPEAPGLVSLAIGDGATQVALVGTLDEIDAILDEARHRIAERQSQHEGKA